MNDMRTGFLIGVLGLLIVGFCFIEAQLSELTNQVNILTRADARIEYEVGDYVSLLSDRIHKLEQNSENRQDTVPPNRY